MLQSVVNEMHIFFVDFFASRCKPKENVEKCSSIQYLDSLKKVISISFK